MNINVGFYPITAVSIIDTFRGYNYSKVNRFSAVFFVYYKYVGCTLNKENTLDKVYKMKRWQNVFVCKHISFYAKRRNISQTWQIADKIKPLDDIFPCGYIIAKHVHSNIYKRNHQFWRINYIIIKRIALLCTEISFTQRKKQDNQFKQRIKLQTLSHLFRKQCVLFNFLSQNEQSEMVHWLLLFFHIANFHFSLFEKKKTFWKRNPPRQNTFD